MIFPYAAAVIISFAVSGVGTKLIMLASRRAAFVDQPGSEPHKQQAAAVPYGGGAAMFIAMTAAMLCSTWMPMAEPFLSDARALHAIVAGAAAMFMLGMVDDLKPMRAGLKLLPSIRTRM
jgi:UDP-N-acetylmuramyl pentapeptide phosphotransferase/UDP-N-acetylglucosamine-1-phosphate transferase